MTGPIQIFPTIYNVKPFLFHEHPVYHPEKEADKYNEYWEGIERKGVEGLWGLDQNPKTKEGGWRYMPPQLFRYINMSVLEDEDEAGTSSELKPPTLIDLAWMMGYGWFVSRGFSGCEDDDEVTCLRAIKSIEEGTKLHPYDAIQLRRAGDSIISKKTGKYKKYVDAIDYLYAVHSRPMGKPYYYNPALDFLVFMSRRGGKSYFLANCLGHTFDFYGKKYYDDKYLVNPEGTPVLMLSSMAEKSTATLNKFIKSRDWQFENLGAYSETLDNGVTKTYPGFFHYNYKGTVESNNAKNPYSAYYKKRLKTDRGVIMKEVATGQTIYHALCTAANPDAGVGGAFPEIYVEEVGLIPNIRAVRGALKPVQIRNIKFGSMFMIGTGGNLGKIQGAKELFEDAEANSILGYVDVFENRKKKTGLFIPGYMVHTAFKDENGNTKLQEAWEFEEGIRKNLEEEGDDYGLELHTTSFPHVPSEMFMSVTANPFPVKYYYDRYREVDVYKLDQLVGTAVRTSWDNLAENKVLLETQSWSAARVITTYHVNNRKHVEGCPVMYEEPDEEALIGPRVNFGSLYKAAYDPINDENGGASLAGFQIYKGVGKYLDRQTGNIVYSYYGRHHNPDDIHNMVAQACTLYNCKVLFELNMGDFLSFAKRYGFLNLCQPTPYHAIGKHVNNPSKKWSVGISMNEELKHAADRLISKWSTKEWKIGETGKQLYYPDKLLDRRLMDEVLNFDPDPKRNYDAISTFRILMLWLENEDRPAPKEAGILTPKLIVPQTQSRYERRSSPWATH